MIQLRDYQLRLVDDAREALRQRLRTLIYLPTGGGKTVIFCYIASRMAENNRRVLILVHRRELIQQTSRALSGLGVRHGVISPRHAWIPGIGVQVASVQTLARRIPALIAGGWNPHMIITDEAHHAVAGQWSRVLQAWPDALSLGVTATPCRTDGRGLGEQYDTLILGPSVRELTDAGYLVPARIYVPPAILDVSSIGRRGGDYDSRALDEALRQRSIAGDVVRHYRQIVQGAPAVAFCVSVPHAERVALELREHGIRAAAVAGSTPAPERDRALADLASGALQVVTSCDVISEGTDIPAVTAAILLRPTLSLGLYRQQVGRALRPARGKDHAVILDHVGNVARHGPPDEDVPWSLEGRIARERDREQVLSITVCEQCYLSWPRARSRSCPSCGWTPPQQDRSESLDLDATADLQELDPASAARLRRARRAEQGSAGTLEDLIRLGRARGYQRPEAWARHVFSGRRKNNC